MIKLLCVMLMGFSMIGCSKEKPDIEITVLDDQVYVNGVLREDFPEHITSLGFPKDATVAFYPQNDTDHQVVLNVIDAIGKAGYGNFSIYTVDK